MKPAPECFGEMPEPKGQAENNCHDCQFLFHCVDSTKINKSGDLTKILENNLLNFDIIVGKGRKPMRNRLVKIKRDYRE